MRGTLNAENIAIEMEKLVNKYKFDKSKIHSNYF